MNAHDPTVQAILKFFAERLAEEEREERMFSGSGQFGYAEQASSRVDELRGVLTCIRRGEWKRHLPKDESTPVAVPVDVFGKTLDEAVIAAVVAHAMFAANPVIVPADVWAAAKDFHAVSEKADPNDDAFHAAVRLAGNALRFAWANRPASMRER